MSRTSEFVWRTARLSIEGLPYLPYDLNEPQYARLLCERNCYVCQRKDCDDVLWTLRARVCQRCVASLPLYDRNYLSKQPEAYRDLGILPSERTVVGRSTRLLGSNKWAKRFREEFQILNTQTERDEWISRKEKEHQDLKKHASLCEKWHRSHIEDLEMTRMDDIVLRLNEFGLAGEAEIMIEDDEDEFISHRLVKQTAKLTDYSWNSMKTELIKLLSNHRAKRVALEMPRFPCWCSDPHSIWSRAGCQWYGR
ncbi:hypothetical protein BDP27DRAFT_1271908 [Rhodocollybia butyracea]|uniref:Uncharacterized protein n=1 Tax=Rhodocollybia butyracea TaxID=206335 RepID=A0A9P5TZV5_9AGAR|nr:hypothetical protein BDP27DRAFT_1271908 [Rhodocollybia butyracea]